MDRCTIKGGVSRILFRRAQGGLPGLPGLIALRHSTGPDADPGPAGVAARPTRFARRRRSSRLRRRTFPKIASFGNVPGVGAACRRRPTVRRILFLYTLLALLPVHRTADCSVRSEKPCAESVRRATLARASRVFRVSIWPTPGPPARRRASPACEVPDYIEVLVSAGLPPLPRTEPKPRVPDQTWPP
jgi:hypothetical protein